MKSTNTLAFGVLLVVMVLVMAIRPASADPPYWDINRVTDNNNIHDVYPVISETTVAWEFWVDGHPEIVYQDLTTMADPCQLTDNTVDDMSPRLDGSNLIWKTIDDGDWDIMYCDLNTHVITRLTDTTDHAGNASIDGSVIVWQLSSVSSDTEVFYYNLDTMADPCQITNNMTPDSYPEVSGTQMVWQGYDPNAAGGKYQIFRYDEQTGQTTNISNDTINHYQPFISQGNIVWQGYVPGASNEIYLYDGVTELITRITNNTYDDKEPRIDGRCIVWLGQPDGSGQDYDIYYYDLDNMADYCRLTNNDYNHKYAKISGRNLVWQGDIPYLSGYLQQIFLQSVHQLPVQPTIFLLQ